MCDYVNMLNISSEKNMLYGTQILKIFFLLVSIP
jgi:hypothetical protein